MKKGLLTIAIAAIFASCSNNKADDQAKATPTIATQDTIGLKDFKEWKEKQELQASQQTYTSPGVNDVVEVPAEKPAPVVVYREAPVRQPRAVKTQKPARQSVYKAPVEQPSDAGVAKAPAPPQNNEKREPYGRGTTGTEGTAGSGTTTTSESEGEGDVAVSTPAPQEAPAKKGGWSKAAKGGAVGGASGAVIGAVISKNKTKGAVIGGIVGAAGGYIFGRKQDKKDSKN
jgi:hypothetical protein